MVMKIYNEYNRLLLQSVVKEMAMIQIVTSICTLTKFVSYE